MDAFDEPKNCPKDPELPFSVQKLKLFKLKRTDDYKSRLGGVYRKESSSIS